MCLQNIEKFLCVFIFEKKFKIREILKNKFKI